MSKAVELLLLTGQSEIQQLHDKLEALALETGIPQEHLHKVQLAAEEYLTNVFKYAFDQQGSPHVKVRLQLENGELCLEFEDEGRPFNLLEHPAPDLTVPLDQRPVGGLGIHMIRQSMDRVEYRRSGDKNIVVMAKRIKTATP
jgi:anti-sigma regulatory factor (Ser/Thr protein kinase)